MYYNTEGFEYGVYWNFSNRKHIGNELAEMGLRVGISGR